jgi:hypothetical protein
MIEIPRIRSGVRLLMLAYGALLLFWMSLEDQTTLPVVILGSGLALLMVVGVVLSRLGGVTLRMRQWLLLLPSAGAVAGALAAVMTACLMFFKTAWHAHPFPDYPPQMMLAMLERVPAWALAGLLVGVAGLLLRMALLPLSSPEQPA